MDLKPSIHCLVTLARAQSFFTLVEPRGCYQLLLSSFASWASMIQAKANSDIRRGSGRVVRSLWRVGGSERPDEASLDDPSSWQQHESALASVCLTTSNWMPCPGGRFVIGYRGLSVEATWSRCPVIGVLASYSLRQPAVAAIMRVPWTKMYYEHC
jgi:hypothetical protein